MLYGAAHRGHLEMAKLLIERGGLVNGVNYWGLTPLSYAKIGGSQEMIDYLRSVGAQYPWELRGEPEPPPPPPQPVLTDRQDRLDYHINNTLNSRLTLFADDPLHPDDPIHVHLVVQEDCWILVTEGMQSHCMVIPPIVTMPDDHDDYCDEYQRAELYIRLPRDWPVSPEWIGLPENQWILDWLHKIARWPREHQQWLGLSAVFANGDPPQPLAPGLPFTCLLVTPTAEEFSKWYAYDNTLVRYYWVYPIYTEERDYERTHGTSALLRKLAENNSPLYIDPARVNVAS
jgi:hypothetical protein